MDEGVIAKECSFSGWMVFLGKDAVKMVEEKYLSDLQDAKKRLEFSKILHERLSPRKIGLGKKDNHTHINKEYDDLNKNLEDLLQDLSTQFRA